MRARLTLCLLLLLAVAAPADAAIVPGWSAAGSTIKLSGSVAAVTLDSGKVLAVDQSNSQVAELFDPVSRTWSPAASMPVADLQIRLFRLGDGRVMALGNQGYVQIYTPWTDTWKRLADLSPVRRFAAATSTSDGKVLVAGGYTIYPNSLPSAVIFNPRTDTWTATNGMPDGRYAAEAVALPNGRVLVTGGVGNSNGPPYNYPTSSAIYYPEGNSWYGALNATQARINFAVTPLGDGRAMALGGDAAPNQPLSSTSIYDPTRNEWVGGPNMSTVRRDFTATLLTNGRVMAIGGWNASFQSQGSVDVFTGSALSSGGALSPARAQHTTVRLADGRVLVIGGRQDEWLKTTMLWTPATTAVGDPDLSFGELPQTVKASAAVQVTNTGSEPLIVGDIAIGGAHPNDFTVSAARCQGMLAPGATCPLDVTFTPTGSGARNATLTYSTNTAAGTTVVPLRGVGLAPAPVPSADSDGDGVGDGLDRCPSLKGPAPRQGCPTGALADPSIAYQQLKRGIKVIAYYVKATTGARVVVECSKGCKRTVLKGRGARRLRIKALNGKRLKNGTRITITVTAPGRLRTTVYDNITRGRRVEGRPRCRLPGGNALFAC